ncbi:MAG: ATP-grasp domain-containing protein [Halobacteriota archaeon]|nr:ATP-grasp domain-containing protein [Halobacteriota archaeon]
MKIMIAEYAVGVGDDLYITEGMAMLTTLLDSFEALGHDVIFPKKVDDFIEYIKRNSADCDCGLVIAPDELLYGFTSILEESTVNLGSSPASVKLCADKRLTSERLGEYGISTPRVFESSPSKPVKKYVVKPTQGCASEGIFITEDFLLRDGHLTTEFVEGDHLSVSIIVGDTTLPLTINKQIIEFSDGIEYIGGLVPCEVSAKEEIIDVAIRSAVALGCRGYVGVDIVSGDEFYVVDVNPRPTTSILGIMQVMEGEIADLIIRAKFGDLPEVVETNGEFTFRLNEMF